jgi:histo-blood group ABO system transferase
MKVGLLLIATNKYRIFLQPLITTADTFFLKNHDVEYFIFTSDLPDINTQRKIHHLPTYHKPWPYMTLERYKLFNNASNFLSQMDFIFYCDVDMKFVDYVSDEILHSIVATIHPGFVGQRGTPETNPNSLAYVAPTEKMQYFAGGFNGGSAEEFLKMSHVLSNNIASDLQKGIIALWHDESHLNRYMIDNPPTKILDPSYCCPEQWLDCPYGRKLLALQKNHAEFREI